MKLPAPSREKQLETAAVIALFLLILVLIKHGRSGIPPVRDVGIYLAALFLLVGVFIRPWAAALTRAWFGLSHAIGAVVSRVVLGVVFLFVLTPLALLRRILERKDLLALRRRSGPDRTYFVRTDRAYRAADLERPW